MQPTSFVLYTVCMGILWVLCLGWAWRQRSYYAFVMVLMAVSCFFSENLAIRLGKYFYGPFKVAILCFGTPSGPVWFPFNHLFQPQVDLQSCQAPNICIPLAVVAMESIILITTLRTTDLLGAPGHVKPFLNALVAVNLDLLIDPVASNNRWCTAGHGPTYSGMGFWTWITGATDVGYWFGVPLINYTTWFCSVFAFTVAVRFFRRYLPASRSIGRELFFAAVAIGSFLIFEFILIFTMQFILNRSYSPVWQWAVLLTLLGVALLVVIPSVRRFNRDHPFNWVPVVSQLFILVFFLIGLVIGRFPGKAALFVVWPVTFLIAATFILAPYSMRRAAGGEK